MNEWIKGSFTVFLWLVVCIYPKTFRYDDHLGILSVWYKFKDSVCLESGCRIWNKLLLGCHPGHLTFIFQAASDTFPTPANLQRHHIQCDVKYSLCGCAHPISTYISGGCPVTLINHKVILLTGHDQVLHYILSN